VLQGSFDCAAASASSNDAAPLRMTILDDADRTEAPPSVALASDVEDNHSTRHRGVVSGIA